MVGFFGLFFMLTHTSLAYSFPLPKNAWFENTTIKLFILVSGQPNVFCAFFLSSKGAWCQARFQFFPLAIPAFLPHSFLMSFPLCSHSVHCLWALCCPLYNQDLASMTCFGTYHLGFTTVNSSGMGLLFWPPTSDRKLWVRTPSWVPQRAPEDLWDLSHLH